MPDKTFEDVYKTSAEDDGTKRRTFMFFGEDLSKIPCIRNSLLYAVSASCGTGILVNLATSRNTIGLSVGIFNVVLFGSWIQCRYVLRQTKHFDKMFLGRRGGDKVNSPLMEGQQADTPEAWLARINANAPGEVRNFRSDIGKGLTQQEAVFESHEKTKDTESNSTWTGRNRDER